MHQMNDMMNTMFSNSFGMFGMGTPAIASPLGSSRMIDRPRTDLMSFGFPGINRTFENIDLMGNSNCHSFSSSTVMTMTSGPDGRPQVYQASASTRTAPGGVKETKKAVCDSRSGMKKIAIGHHIGERAHVLEREQNLHSGDREERQEFINLDEDEAEDFNKEFEQKTRQSVGAIGYSSPNSSSNRHGRRHREPQLALPPSSSSSRLRSRSYLPSSYDRRSHRSSPVPLSSGSSSVSLPQERAKKRDHEPDVERKHKALKPSHSHHETDM
ncbi:myeloid leukemia factor isoform X3 [Zootermopsis nevadensis]|nr:myeloid leukemia factor isoform X3 [Zootermopsis nevadensis]